LTNEGWLEKQHGSGIYVKSAKMDKSCTGVIGVVTTYVDDYIFPSIIQGIEDVLTQQGYPISLGLTGNKVEKEDSCLRAMLDQNVDGPYYRGDKKRIP
jgi:GntR family transcriptional regulator of arabinose operon